MNRPPVIPAAFLLALCASAVAAKDISKDELKKALDDNPDVVIDFLKGHKKEVFAVVNQAAQEEQARQQKAEAENEKKAFEESFRDPKTPAIDDKTRIRGSKDAKYTLVEYSDFQCPYCTRGFQTVEALRKKYGGKLRFIYKHLPLIKLHPQAMPAARYLEAVALQSPDKAWVFHDKLFENQDKLGEPFFKETARTLGLDVKKLEEDAGSQAVKDKIQGDVNEATAFGFTGTPGFLLNGVPVRGAYPIEFFDSIIERLESRERKK